MGEKSNGRTIAIGLMLFALFFGAGNLIFPASMGQNAGGNVWWAVLGFVITGVSLPVLGVLAMGYSGCKNLEELAGRAHPKFGLFFCVISYLTIGPFFATPRTGSVSYEIAVRPFLGDGGSYAVMVGFLVLFFAISYWLSATPQKLVDRIGKILTPTLLFVILLLIIKSLVTPMGEPQAPTAHYATSTLAAIQGFIDGYGTMDAIASLVFSLLVIDAVKEDGITDPKGITKEVFKAGLIAGACLGFVYIFIAYLGATSVPAIGIQETGAPVLSLSAMILFGNIGAVILAVIVLLACLSTSVGLITSNAVYFNDLIGHLSYKQWVAVFTLISFGVALFGLKTIIVAAIPVLMFIYPLIISTIILTFLHNSFGGRQCVWAWTTALTFIPALVTGLQTAGIPLGAVDTFFNNVVPLQAYGMSWVTFTIVGLIIGVIWKAVVPSKNVA
ncbi:MAG: branched-chain amino acid transport system II carrier protein [Megasphaera sp.]|jgi:LIVCS family branched-chain amino acid:cation transporter|nr:branched-chain amino acid transport system II carrier protein [Megasphaera sp.]MCH4187955.1 branched-chain amino acid transport system II carrier protein [Megasphaera sp.]